jgi:hypothetical protein
MSVLRAKMKECNHLSWAAWGRDGNFFHFWHVGQQAYVQNEADWKDLGNDVSV